MSLYGSGDYMSEYIEKQINDLKRLMHATAIHFDLLGVTLTIEGQPLFIPQEALSPLRTLVGLANAPVCGQARMIAASIYQHPEQWKPSKYELAHEKIGAIWIGSRAFGLHVDGPFGQCRTWSSVASSTML
jgi:hypothetical protein